MNDYGQPSRPPLGPRSSAMPPGKPSFHPLRDPNPSEPSPVKRWALLAALAFLVLIASYFLWSWLSSDVGYTRVGPRPKEGRTVVVLLHGYGAPGDDLVGLAEEFSKALPEASFLVPEGPHGVGMSGRAWVPDFRAPSRDAYGERLAVEIDTTSKRVWELIDDARESGARCNDIYIAGFSQGGRTAAEVALRAPQDCNLGGVIVMSGGGFEEVDLPSPDNRPPMRVLVTHGTADRLVGKSRGLIIANHLSALGHDVRWLQFDGPHAIVPEVREAVPAFLRGETVGAALSEEP